MEEKRGLPLNHKESNYLSIYREENFSGTFVKRHPERGLCPQPTYLITIYTGPLELQVFGKSRSQSQIITASFAGYIDVSDVVNLLLAFLFLFFQFA